MLFIMSRFKEKSFLGDFHTRSPKNLLEMNGYFYNYGLVFGAIQIIRDTPRGRRGQHCHQITKEGQSKCRVIFFCPL